MTELTIFMFGLCLVEDLRLFLLVIIYIWPLFGKGYKALSPCDIWFILDYIQIPVPERWYELKMSSIQVIIYTNKYIDIIKKINYI